MTRLRERWPWTFGVFCAIVAGVRAIQYDRAEQRRLNRRHLLNLTSWRR